MVADASLIVVIAFGVAIFVLSAWGMLVPQKLLDFVGSVVNRRFGIGIAVGVRVVFGAALIIGAPASGFPVVFAALGWIALVAAAGLPFLGRARMRRFIDWYTRLGSSLIRLWLLAGLAFGGFLIYGAAR